MSRFSMIPLPFGLADAIQTAGSCAVGGGHVVRHLIGAEPGKDVDVFVWSAAAMTELTRHLVSLGWNWEDENIRNDYDYVAVTEVHLTRYGEVIDLIYNQAWRSADDAVRSFDLTPCQVWTESGDMVYGYPSAFEAIDAMEMSYTGHENVRTLPRLERYAAMGFRLVPRA